MRVAGLFNRGRERAATEISSSMDWAVVVGPAVLAAALWVSLVEEIDERFKKNIIICWLS